MFCVVVAHVMLPGGRFFVTGVITDTQNASENRFVVQTLKVQGEGESIFWTETHWV